LKFSVFKSENLIQAQVSEYLSNTEKNLRFLVRIFLQSFDVEKFTKILLFNIVNNIRYFVKICCF